MTAPIDTAVLPHVVAALQHYRNHILARRVGDPFNVALVAELYRNDHAMHAVRESLNDWRPNLGIEPL